MNQYRRICRTDSGAPRHRGGDVPSPLILRQSPCRLGPLSHALTSCRAAAQRRRVSRSHALTFSHLLAFICSLLFATGSGAQESWQFGSDPTNRLSVSFRLGFNITGKFKGLGSSFTSGPLLSGGRKTPNGAPYNYDNGYVLTDSSGNYGGQTWYWGYDNASQVNSAASTISFTRTAATGFPSQTSTDNSPYYGVELAYRRELVTREEWAHTHFGVEAALNFMPISFNSGGLFNAALSQRTDVYGYTPGTTPPSVPPPYQGSFGGPGFVINVPAASSLVGMIPGATLLAQQHFDADLWGLRLGPYAELPLSPRLDLGLSAGVAAGILDGDASWRETLTLPAHGGLMMASGSGHDTAFLYGLYIGATAAYQITPRWSAEAGLQFQDLGTYNHNFQGRTGQLDLSQSIFLHAGVGFSF